MQGANSDRIDSRKSLDTGPSLDAERILACLRDRPRRIPSHYFYDSLGSELFRRIMELPSYYLTRCETEVLTRHAAEIAAHCRSENLVVVDLGAGDGSKTQLLLDALRDTCSEVVYSPVDVSAGALEALSVTHRSRFPAIGIDPVAGDYTSGLERTGWRYPRHRRLALFLGSNIGNLSPAAATQLLRTWRASLRPGDFFLIGFDLIKDPEILQRAYDDEQGVTAAFNLNLLQRLNREFCADFKLDAFRHFARFDPRHHAMESYLLSTRDQLVRIGGERLGFGAWEAIHTEISCKYRESDVLAFARASGFLPIQNYTDTLHYFLDALWCSQ